MDMRSSPKAVSCWFDSNRGYNMRMKYLRPSDYKSPIEATVDATLGYLYFMDKEHPLADKKGRVWHHRHVASVKTGRWLSKDEVAHHDDENKSNNAPDNLIVETKAEHAKRHMLDRAIAAGLALRVQEAVVCAKCGESFLAFSGALYCSRTCSQAAQRRFDVSKEELLELVRTRPMTHIGKMFGVSDTAVRKRCKRLGVL